MTETPQRRRMVFSTVGKHKRLSKESFLRSTKWSLFFQASTTNPSRNHIEHSAASGAERRDNNIDDANRCEKRRLAAGRAGVGWLSVYRRVAWRDNAAPCVGGQGGNTAMIASCCQRRLHAIHARRFGHDSASRRLGLQRYM